MNDARRADARGFPDKVMQFSSRPLNPKPDGAVLFALIEDLGRYPDTLASAHATMGFETDLHQRTGRLCTP